MRRSRLSSYKQARLVEHFVAGTTARTAASLVGVNKSTAAYYFLRLRELIAAAIEDHTPFHGEVEVDESFFGGKRKGKGAEARPAKCPYSAFLSGVARFIPRSYPMSGRAR